MRDSCRSTLLALTSFAVTFVCAIYAMSSAHSWLDLGAYQEGVYRESGSRSVRIKELAAGLTSGASPSQLGADPSAHVNVAAETRYYRVPLHDATTLGNRMSRTHEPRRATLVAHPTN